MPNYTKNLNLFKYDPSTDGSMPFDVQKALNDNFDKIDSNSIGMGNMTNCILEIPQRIKYTLEDGLLTIKAGSVVIFPYGTEDLTEQYPKGSRFLHDKFKTHNTQFEDSKFFVWAELLQDISASSTIADTTIRNTAILTNGSIGTLANSAVAAGGYTGTSNCYSWDTDTNIISYITSGEIKGTACLPFMRIKADGTNLHGSVEQVFNGIGYLSNAIWIDKDVKCLVPNGRNENGTLRNIEYTTEKFLWHVSTNMTGTYVFGIELSNNDEIVSKDHIICDNKSIIYEQDNKPTSTMVKWLDTCNNQFYFWSETDSREVLHTPYKIKNTLFGECQRSSGIITSFTPKQSITVADAQDIVRKTGDTMTGDLTILKSNATFFTRNPNIDITDSTAPTSTIINGRVLFTDKDYEWVGYAQSTTNASNQMSTGLGVRRSIDGTLKSGGIAISMNASGTLWATAPASAIAGSICTTAAISKAANGYVKFGNGIIIQWGTLGVTGGNNYKITFPTAFTSTNYRVTANWWSSGAVNFDDILMINTKAVASCYIYAGETGAGGAQSLNANWIAIGY